MLRQVSDNVVAERIKALDPRKNAAFANSIDEVLTASWADEPLDMAEYLASALRELGCVVAEDVE